MTSPPPHGESLLEELKRYVRFTPRDAELIAAFSPLAAPHFERIATEFYERTREHEDAHAVFVDEAQIDRLQRSLVRWLERVCTGVYDEEYARATARIGRVHVEVGLPQRYMLSAMALIRHELVQLAHATMGEHATAVQSAICRMLDVDLALMLEAYRDHLIARLQRIEEIERRQLGRALAQSEHRYRNAVELARLLIVGLDTAGNVLIFNREAERVTGFARDELLGAPFTEALLPEALREEQGGVFAAALAGGPFPPTLDSLVRTRSGRGRDVKWHLTRAPEGERGDVALFVMGADVTDEKALAERMRQSEKLAAVGTLAAGLAHEIRNPLNGAQLHITFLERALRKMGADDDTKDALRVVGDELHRLSNLVSEFLDFARPRPLTLKPTSLHALCRHAVRLCEANAAEAHVTLEVELPATELVLQADPERLSQVLLNLVRNAIEAMAPAGGKVVLRARRKPRHALIEVEDEGPGVPPEAPIFDAFYSTKQAGTGLGLSIVHRIVTDHGGAIDVDSRPGRTLMRVSLPLEVG